MNEYIGFTLIGIGIIYDILACLGLVRMPDVYTRLQAATKAVTVGTTFILIGAAVYAGPGPLAAKALICMIFVLLTNPASAHVIARAAHSSGIRVERVTADGLLGREIESELWDVTRRKDQFEKDRLVRIFETCTILDIDEHINSDSLFEIIGEPIATARDSSPREIARRFRQREREAVTALKPEFAIPHIIIDGSGGFEMVVARGKNGIWFSNESPKVSSVFAMAGTEDQWHFYLRVLAVIAQVVRMEDFYDEWHKAGEIDDIRRLLITRVRIIGKNR